MDSPIKIFTPNAEQFARGTAVNMAFRFGMPNNPPLKASDVVGWKGNPDFNKEDYMGLVISETLTLSYTDISVTPYKEYNFTFNECLITLNLPKNIVTTALQGRPGTIKEYVADDDFQISLDAAIDSYVGNEESEERFAYPKEQIKDLFQILKLPVELVITSEFLSMFKIDSVVVKEFGLQQETHMNRQSIQIQLLSDNPYEIKLKNQKDVKIG